MQLPVYILKTASTHAITRYFLIYYCTISPYYAAFLPHTVSFLMHSGLFDDKF